MKKKTDIRIGEVKLGAQQQCPKCKSFNPSGLTLPEECRFCANQLILPGFEKPIKC